MVLTDDGVSNFTSTLPTSSLINTTAFPNTTQTSSTLDDRWMLRVREVGFKPLLSKLSDSSVRVCPLLFPEHMFTLRNEHSFLRFLSHFLILDSTYVLH